MLPHFVAEDFADVLRDTADHGLPPQIRMVRPAPRIPLPRLGTIDLPAAGGIQLELRQAIEPWYVLGEEPAGGGTARFVDSSVERLQIKVNGLTNSRHVVAVNGIAIPLHPTGRNGEFVAGVRYRAWQPPSLPAPHHRRSRPRWSSTSSTPGTTTPSAAAPTTSSHPGGRAYDHIPRQRL